MIKINFKMKIIVIFIFTVLFFAFTAAKDKDRDKNKLNKNTNVQATDAYRLKVNKINMGMNNKGVLADVNIDGQEGGYFDGKVFLFSGGFFLSGYYNSILFGTAMATASRFEDYEAGTVSKGETPDKRIMYILKSSDPHFGTSWDQWKDAVAMGAYFYDGDKDGIYNPVDLNSNGKWDSNEDMPDLLGDETVWCAYNDGVESTNRAAGYRENKPLGIEIRQSVWGYATSGALGNILFIRYSINYTGITDPSITNPPAFLDSVFFGAWADPDLGDPYDDLVGCDTTLISGFVYNLGGDPEYGDDPPAFLIDFFQGPWDFTGNNADTAYNVKGTLLGIDTIPGAKNLPLGSFVHYMQGHPTQGDPDNTQQMRSYAIGRNQQGATVDPCNWLFGAVYGQPCTEINPVFMYSGDPVSLTGWINTNPDDQRQMSNTGPFKLEKNKPVDIVVAYVGGRSNSALNSLKEVKRIDRSAQFVYQNNFNYPAPPPVVTPVISTGDQSITLTWETSPQLGYGATGRGYNMVFEGYEVNMYQTNSTSELEGGRNNKILLASYDVANGINNVLEENGVSLEIKKIYEQGTQLDSALYIDPTTGRVSLKITTDPFANAPLIKGKPYFISIDAFALNREEIVRMDALGNYLIPGTAAVGIISTIPTILNDGVSGVGIVPGKDTYAPYKEGIETEKVAGPSVSKILYSVVDKSKVTNDIYEVSFDWDSTSTLYNLLYSIKNKTTGQILFDSLQQYDTYDVRYSADGVMLNVEWIDPGVDTVEFKGSEKWFTDGWQHDSIGVFYVGKDFVNPNGIPDVIATKNSTAINVVNDVRRVELRFGQTGKAYRYVKKPIRFTAGGGNLDSAFLDVPFQAWIKDDRYGTERQLAVGFTETAFNGDSLGKADGKYDPGTNVAGSKEYILIFNAPYDPTGSQVEFTGTGTGSAAQKVADLGNGYAMDPTNPKSTDSLKNIAKSPYFNAMFVVGLQRTSDATAFNPTGTYSININYPLTTKDVYTYKVDTDLSVDEEKERWQKVNVFPNPLFAHNPLVSYTGQAADDPYITFSNLPNQVTIKIYSLSGALLRTLTKDNFSPFFTWNLKNEDNLRVASGMYIAIVSNPQFGDKILKFAIIMPQKQITQF